MTYGTLSSGMRELCHWNGWSEDDVMAAFEEANMFSLTELDDDATICGKVGRLLGLPWERLLVSFEYSLAYWNAARLRESRLNDREISGRDQRSAWAMDAFFKSCQPRTSRGSIRVDDVQERLTQIYRDYPDTQKRSDEALEALLAAFSGEIP